MLRRLLGALALALCVFAVARPAMAGETEERPRLFLICPTDCFDTYVRQELNYFDFVRDRHQADRSILIVRQPSGGGGERFSVSLLSRDPDEAPLTDSFTTRPGAQPEIVRHELVQTILRLLLENYRDTKHARAFELRLPYRDGLTLSRQPDPWDYWVFVPELRFEGFAGSAIYFMELLGGVTVRRITDEHKLRFHSKYVQNLSRFVLEDGSDERGSVFRVEGQAIYAYSLAKHWGLGGIATARTSEYENLRGHVRGGPLVEYNIFPYLDNAHQQLRFAYQIGAWRNWYFEVNRDGLLGETRPYHAISFILDFNRPWGSVQWVVQGNSFLNDFSLSRLSTGGTFSLLLTEGLAILLEGQVSYIQDQISLRARPLTDLELLLGTAQLPTDFTAELSFGLSYTWGSIHNTIVNPRFGRVDVDTE